MGFLGGPENNGEKYVKYSDDSSEFLLKGAKEYLGQWSAKTNKPHGRGISVSNNGAIFLQYSNEGVVAPGNYIVIDDELLAVGVRYLDILG